MSFGDIMAGKYTAGARSWEGNAPPSPKLSPKKRLKEMLARDAETLKSNPMGLGYTQAQQRQMKDEANQEAAARAAQSATELGRQALAGNQNQAAAFERAGQQAADLNQATASVSAEVSKANLQKIDQEKARILTDLMTERQIRRENVRYWAQYGLSGVDTVSNAIGTLMTGGAGGA